MEIRQRPDAGTRPGPETSPAGAVTMRVVGATAIALAASMAIQNAVFIGTGPPAYGDPIEEVLAWHVQNRVTVAVEVLSRTANRLAGWPRRCRRRRASRWNWRRQRIRSS